MRVMQKAAASTKPSTKKPFFENLPLFFLAFPSVSSPIFLFSPSFCSPSFFSFSSCSGVALRMPQPHSQSVWPAPPPVPMSAWEAPTSEPHAHWPPPADYQSLTQAQAQAGMFTPPTSVPAPVDYKQHFTSPPAPLDYQLVGGGPMPRAPMSIEQLRQRVRSQYQNIMKNK